MAEYGPSSNEQALKALARALAPYLADELRGLEELRRASLNPDFDGATCSLFVAGLGEQVRARAAVMFELLRRHGVIDSLQLASALGITPRELSGYLTTPLKRRASALQLPLPFDGGKGTEPYGGVRSPSPDMDPERTHWQDRDGIAERMLAAIAHPPETSQSEAACHGNQQQPR
jgi:hypothetical protein